MKSISAALLGSLVAFSALAQPAPWYEWESKLDKKKVCRQTSPGDGWTKIDVAYKDARCEKKQ